MTGTRSWRLQGLAAALTAGAWVAASGCAALAPRPPTPPPAHPPPPPPPPASPFSDSPVSFLIRGAFSRGEQVLVRVCLNADHSIASTAVLESSGDPRFDALAVNWARRVPLRSAAPTDGAPIAHCGAVRVELHQAAEPLGIGGSDSLVG